MEISPSITAAVQIFCYVVYLSDKLTGFSCQQNRTIKTKRTPIVQLSSVIKQNQTFILLSLIIEPITPNQTKSNVIEYSDHFVRNPFLDI